MVGGLPEIIVRFSTVCSGLPARGPSGAIHCPAMHVYMHERVPEEFGKWSSVYRQFRRWTVAGLWDMILEALNDSGAMPD